MNTEKKINPSSKESATLFSGYFPAIDGLRAVAVVAVIINHFNASLMPSGYLGVDIFFVISGFVITSSLANRQNKGIREYLAGFYSRRIKRLTPALFVCVLCTGVAFCLFNPEPHDQLITGITSLFGFSNINLYLNALDYWGSSAKLNPFTHTWSLGVEEQFYLVFPLLLWFTILRGKNRHHWLIALLSALSLAGFVQTSKTNPAAAFYLMPFRFWELGIGSMLFITLNGKSDALRRALERVPSTVITAILILVLFIPYQYTVQATIAAVILTAVLIALLAAQKPSSSPLGHAAVVYIGLISYSLYLWHWSILALSRWTIGIHWWSAPIQLGLMLLLAAGSYQFIERPMRGAAWLSTKSRAAACGLVSLAGFTLLIMLVSKTNLPLLSKPAAELLYSGTKQKAPAISTTVLESIQCGQTQTADQTQTVPKVLRTIGNSHSLHIMPMLRILANKCGLSLIAEKHPDYIDYPSGLGRLKVNMDALLEPLEKADILILSSRNRYLYSIPYLSATGDEWFDHSELKQKHGIGLQTWLSELDLTIAKASEKGVNVIFFLPNIEFTKQVLPYDIMCQEQWFRITSSGCNPAVDKDFLQQRFPAQFYDAIEKRAQENANFFVFDPLPIYCKPDEECTRLVEGVNAFKDTNHLTPAGAQLMLGEFNAFLLRNRLL